MKQRSGLFLLLTLWVASYCSAFDVVLNNGKVLTGQVMEETEDMIVLLDTSGVKLYIKKSQVDTIKTQERNQKTEVAPAESEPPDKTAPIAEEQPKKKARVYKKEDLEKMPELSVVGGEESPDDEALRKENEARVTEEEELEAAWNEEALRLNDEIQAAREAYESNKSFCDKVIPDLDDFPAGTPTQLTAEQYEQDRRYACMEAESAAKDLEKAQADYEEFLEEARKKGIPPGWVDPDRIRN